MSEAARIIESRADEDSHARVCDSARRLSRLMLRNHTADEAFTTLLGALVDITREADFIASRAGARRATAEAAVLLQAISAQLSPELNDDPALH